MAKKQGFSLQDLKDKNMVEVTPGVFQKASLPQPRDREKIKELLNQRNTVAFIPEGLKQRPVPIEDCFLTDDDVFDVAGLNKIIANKKNNTRTINISLFGIPMPKQSVRAYCTKKVDKASGRHILAHFQPKELDERKDDYIRQLRAQLPKDFQPFMTEVFVTKFHCIYPPLKGFSKKKMDAIRNGEIFYKNTQPDLIDNLKKLVFDCLGKNKEGVPLVLGNDGIIVGEDNTRKYYGIGGSILLTLTGY